MGSSTTSTPEANHEQLCLTREAAEHVYEVVLHDKPVTPLYLDSEHAKHGDAAVEAELNPYAKALLKPVDQQLQQKSFREMKKTT